MRQATLKIINNQKGVRNMRKLTSGIVASAMFFALTVPAFADFGFFNFGGTSENTAIIKNTSTAQSITGGNQQGTEVSTVGSATGMSTATAGTFGGSESMGISTGNATSQSTALVMANTQVGCPTCSIKTQKDFAMVTNDSFAGSDTGENLQVGETATTAGASMFSKAMATTVGGTRTMSTVTGSAGSTSRSWTIVNTRWN